MMRQVAFITLVFGGLVLVGVGAGYIWLAAKLASVAHMQFWDLVWLKPDFNQLYPGTIVRALDYISTAGRQILLGLFILGLAFIVRAHARFYERLRAELLARNA